MNAVHAPLVSLAVGHLGNHRKRRKNPAFHQTANLRPRDVGAKQNILQQTLL